MTVFLDLGDLLVIAERAIGGIPPVRDHGLLESAAARPRTTVFGQEAYPTVLDKAAALCASLVCNHALVDGNKRLGWLATWVFCDLNGVELRADQDTVVGLIVEIADGSLTEVADIAARLARMTSPEGSPGGR